MTQIIRKAANIHPHLRQGSRSKRRSHTCSLCWPNTLLLAAILLASHGLFAAPFITPGDPDLRSDLQLLSDEGVLRDTLMVWPLSWNDVLVGLDSTPMEVLDPPTMDALNRIRARAAVEATTGGPFLHTRIAMTDQPQLIRSLESTPREKGELELGVSWTSDRFAAEINVTRVLDAAEDDYRLDGSYLSMAVGNWALSIGMPERWWGPGWQGSLLLSTNARPVPQLGIQRIASKPFESKWLRWIGPWSLVSFMGQLNDDRGVNDALLFGMRVTLRPLPHLDIGLSRTAQWCGDGRSCSLTTFGNLLVGNDNRGVNVGEDEEPGNQLGGIDARWSLRKLPLAVYVQWIGEDTRQGGPQIGSWLRQLGGELWGGLPWTGWRHRSHLELSDTICQEGGTGFGGDKYNCTYEHNIYQTGYRFHGRSLGHGSDSDSESIAIGSTLIGPMEQSWNLAIRHMKINQGPIGGPQHTISQTPLKYADLNVSHKRKLPLGEMRIQLRFDRQEDELTGLTSNDSSISFEWRFGY